MKHFLTLTIFGPSERKGEETRSRDEKGTVIAIVKAILQFVLFLPSFCEIGRTNGTAGCDGGVQGDQDAIAICQSRGRWGARCIGVSENPESGNSVAVGSDGGRGGVARHGE